jgi:molybdenum cofactor cytidylyltransferase
MACLLKGGGGLYNRLSLGAVVLAAGQGSRLGHRPKSLIELAGIPLIRRQLIALSGAGVDQLVVVLGHYATQIRPFIEDFQLPLLTYRITPKRLRNYRFNRGFLRYRENLTL